MNSRTGEYRLLLTFLQRPKIVLTRDQLLDLAFDRGADVFDRAVDTQVSRLRRKIEIDAARTEIDQDGLGRRLRVHGARRKSVTWNPFNTLTGRMVLVTIVAVIVSYAVALGDLANERGAALRRAAETSVIERVAYTAERLREAPPASASRIVRIDPRFRPAL